MLDRAEEKAPDNPDLESARRVLRLEAEGLLELANSLKTEFVDAVDLMAKIKGRVVVTGMGKSGLVGGKIAATLASTGTPAFFVHPAEASHGDLGMITGKDAVLALSNSGETVELADVVGYVKRFQIPLLAITRRRDSTLARAATVPLIIPCSDEACPMGLTPTTSTTTMMAFGDALAVALLKRKGFSSDDFQVFHPGGKLGSRLLKVADIMHQGDEIPLVGEAALIQDAIFEITEKRLGCVGVVDSSGRLSGVFTDGDLRRHVDGSNLSTQKVGEIMTKGPKTVNPDMLASQAVHIMNLNSITNLFVVRDGKPCGALHIHDCLRAGVA